MQVAISFISSIFEIIDYVMLLAYQNSDLVVSFIMPFIIEFLNKDIVGRKEKVYVSLISCLVASAILNWGNLMAGNFTQLIDSLAIIVAGSQAMYQLYFKGSYYQNKIQDAVGKNDILIPERLVKMKPEIYGD